MILLGDAGQDDEGSHLPWMATVPLGSTWLPGIS